MGPRNLLGHAGELAGGADATGAMHARGWLVGFDVASPGPIVHVGVLWRLLVRGVGGGGLVGVGGTSAAAGRGAATMAIICVARGQRTCLDWIMFSNE